MESVNKNVPFLKLPDEVIVFIFGKVDNITDYKAIGQVCRKFSTLVNTNTLYRTVKIKEETAPEIAVDVLQRYSNVIRKLHIDRYLGPEEGKELTDEIPNLKNLEALTMHDILWYNVSVQDIRTIVVECKKLRSLKLDDVNVTATPLEWETVLEALEGRKMKKLVFFVHGDYFGESLHVICENSKDTLECLKVKPEAGFGIEDVAICKNLKKLDFRFNAHTRVSIRPLMGLELTSICLIFAVVDDREYIEFFSRPCAVALKKVQLLDCFFVTPEEVIAVIMRNCVNLEKIGIKVELHDLGEDIPKDIIFHVLDTGKKLKFVSLSPVDAADAAALHNINPENYPKLLNFSTFTAIPYHFDSDDDLDWTSMINSLKNFAIEYYDSSYAFPPEVLLQYYKGEENKIQLLYLHLMLHIT